MRRYRYLPLLSLIFLLGAGLTQATEAPRIEVHVLSDSVRFSAEEGERLDARLSCEGGAYFEAESTSLGVTFSAIELHAAEAEHEESELCVYELRLHPENATERLSAARRSGDPELRQQAFQEIEEETVIVVGQLRRSGAFLTPMAPGSES